MKEVKAKRLKAGDQVIGADGEATTVSDAYRLNGLVWLELTNGQSGARGPNDTVVKP
ncbi:hypothetical protein [Amycolatopsis sp. GM8]|uniref:hypothetical protein n=1 Tax=Amycolatopsis sp. GM8 TaxID=2896530 RepID=UPI001F301E3D|nr:hypothetical protein [Amycolatopsis sp. GM8]